jgi:mannose-1-phosphate guanylyltransferase/mannose-6-phosphate isomerase
MAESRKVALILAGGSGTRFWPLSKPSLPKQYLRLFGKRSLIQHTWDRLTTLCTAKDIFVCSGRNQAKHLKHQVPKAKTIFEPAACNTGPAVLLSMLDILSKGYPPSTVVAVFPADHYIVDTASFTRVLNSAYAVAQQTQGLVTLGIVPLSPQTGYGYIEAGATHRSGARTVVQFVEKPEREKAEAFLKKGGFYWNSGIFIWQLGAILEAYRILAPKEFEAFSQARTPRAISKAYQSLSPLPVDKMILEKASNVFVVPAEMGWSDVGSWSSLQDLKPSDSSLNCVEAERTALLDSEGCFVHAPGKTVSLIGMKNVIVVADGDSLLVCAKASDQSVGKAALALKNPEAKQRGLLKRNRKR